jgi:peptide-methionine (R)-S-oxide reductase
MKIYHKIVTIVVIGFVFMACKKNLDKPTLSDNTTTTLAVNNQELKLDLNDTNLSPVKKSDTEWKKVLTSNQYYILREQGTERPFNNEFHDNHDKGNYFCAGCGLPLFNSETKFDSGTGWPSFYAPIQKSRVKESIDNSLGMVRGEIVCARCEGHLGHVFDDGPKPTGLRYCMNSGAMLFQKSK